MKTVTGIDAKAHHFVDEMTPEEQSVIPTYRRLMLNALGGSKAKDAEESVDMYQALLKIRGASDKVDLEDAEFRLVLNKCKENAIGWPAIWQGQIITFLGQFDGHKNGAANKK